MIFGTPLFEILAFYLDFEGAKNIHVLQVVLWGFGGCWRFMTGVLHPHIDLDMVSDLLYSIIQNFGSILIFRVQMISVSFKS